MKPGAPRKPPAIRIWKETAHRGGKGVSAIHGVPLPGPQLEELCSALKKKCGTGGTVKNGVIEIQGDHRDRLVETELSVEQAMRIVLTGGVRGK